MQPRPPPGSGEGGRPGHSLSYTGRLRASTSACPCHCVPNQHIPQIRRASLKAQPHPKLTSCLLCLRFTMQECGVAMERHLHCSTHEPLCSTHRLNELGSLWSVETACHAQQRGKTVGSILSAKKLLEQYLLSVSTSYVSHYILVQSWTITHTQSKGIQGLL